MPIPDYVLTVRKPGTARLSRRVMSGAGDLDAPRLIILIHGSANPEELAAANYERFRTTLRAELGLDDLRRLGTFWEFHWPTDEAGPDIGRVRSRLRYEDNVKVATLAGITLANFIAKRLPHQEVVLVAHSLGCMVALECLAHLREEHECRGANVTATCLMAAAVPTSLCEENEEFGEAHPSCREEVLHSSRDMVLKLAFPLGQRHYEEGDAVGLTGLPSDRWLGHPDTLLGHKRYWSDRGVAEVVGQMLGHVHERTLRERPLEERPYLGS